MLSKVAKKAIKAKNTNLRASAKAIMEKIEKKIKLLGYLLGDTDTSSTVIGDEILLYTTELSINPPPPKPLTLFGRIF